MESRLSVISIIVENTEATGEINTLLHKYSEYIVGRMGIPYREKGVSVICVVLDASQSVTSTLSGKLGMLKGVSAKTVTSANPMKISKEKES